MIHLATLLLALVGVLGAQDAPTDVPATVATHYFYWYRFPDQHFGGEGREGHLHHFVAEATVSYESADWHRAEFRDMTAAGIGIALPVYWGYPGCEDRANVRFAVAGLAPMVRALDAMAEAGEPGPKLGLFYDTSTLHNGVRGVEPRGARTDLTTASGLALFCDTVLGFFVRVPKRHWGRHEGRPLVVLYTSGFAERWDDQLLVALRARFAEHFDGERPFVVADSSWGAVGQDATTSWGAALTGVKIHDRVAQLGPGYDDSPVPGRHTPFRPREDGAFYAASWRAAIESKARLVLIETWNEMHEGTEVCRTKETGDRYLRMTRDGSDRLRRGEPGPPIGLRFDGPRSRPDHSWGDDARDRAEVAWNAGSVQGLRPVRWEDGPIERDGELLCARCPAGRPVTYLYLQVADAWRFDVEPGVGLDLELVIEATGDLDTLTVEFDSHDRSATLDGAYTPGRSTDSPTSFRLPRARLANRQNGGSDLRLVVRGRVAIEGITLRPAPR